MPNNALGRAKQYLPIIVAVAVYFAIMSFFFGNVCPLVVFLGLPCPTCGMTRAALLFLQGRFIDSFWMHPLFLPTATAITYLTVCALFFPHRLKRTRLLVVVWIAAVLLVYVIRMIYMFPNQPPLVINEDSVFHNLLLHIRR